MNEPMLCQIRPSTSQRTEMTKSDLKQVVAIAVITRLQEWCVQLFWITILCVMGCGDEESAAKLRSAATRRHSAANATQPRQLRNNLAEIEMKLLRHLTSPQLSKHRSTRVSKRKMASRPPSPQLFDILEENE